MDETIPVTAAYSVSKKVEDILLGKKPLKDSGLISIDADGYLRPLDSEYAGGVDTIMNLLQYKKLKRFKPQVYMWNFDIEILKAFSEVTVLTFLFEKSHMQEYLSLHNINYSLYYVDNECICAGKQDLTEWKELARNHLHIYKGKLNDVGKRQNALSKKWYSNIESKGVNVKTVMNNAYNFFMNIQHAHVDDCLWTTFKSVYERKHVKSFKRAYTACNLRATNEHRQKHYLAYLINKYEHPYIVQWYHEQGCTISQDAFALSELIQWIWRSAIRNSPMEDVYLYIPSKRMREL